MKIKIDRNAPDSRQSAVVEIDTKYCHYPYAIRESIELALKLDGYDERTIDEVFCRERVELEQEKGCVDCIDDTDYMSKEKYNQIIDEAYENYLKNCLDKKWMKENFFYDGSSNHHLYLKEEFIDKCKTDPEFSEKWGLKIEERELSLEERKSIYENEYTKSVEVPNNHWLNSKLTTRNIPTKLITITYNNEKIESYES